MSFSAGKNLQNNVNVTEAQTLSNKTLDNTTTIQSGADIQTPAIIDPSRADVKKDTLANLQTYASTASNGQLVYATDSKKMFQVLDGALAEVGGGSAGINYITNPDAEVNADGWSNYANSVAGELPDDFGGTVSGSWDNIAASAASPLRGSKSFVFGGINSGSGDLQGHGVYSSFTVDSADLAKKLTISFDYKLDDSALTNAVDGMLKVFIYDEDKSQLIRVNGEDIKLNANTNTHIAQFQTDATSTNYRLVIHNALALNVAEDFSMKIDNVQVGPREVVKGAAMTDWVEYTPVLKGFTSDPSLGSTSVNRAYYRRVGDSLEFRAEIQQTSAGSPGSGNYYFELPNNLQADLDKINASATTGLGTVGSASARIASGNYEGTASVINNNGVSIYIGNAGSNTSYVGSSYLSTSNSEWRLSFEATVPIVGWSSNAITSEDLGGREVVVEGAGNGGTSITADFTNIDFTEVTDTTSSWNGTQFTAPETGTYSLSGNILFTAVGIRRPEYYINGTLSGRLGDAINSDGHKIDCQISLTKGEVLSIRVTGTGGTLSNSTTGHTIHIQKLASPQTILETETVAAFYRSNDGQFLTGNVSNTVVYEDKEEDTHNAYNTSTGVYTVPVSGYYSISAGVGFSASISPSQSARCWIIAGGRAVAIDRRPGTNTTSFYGIQTSIASIYLEKGEEVSVSQFSEAGTVLTTVNSYNIFSIARIK
jgi:hypothetical protein